MASLKSGVLQKLYEGLKTENDNNAVEDDPKPVLLQIRSIIPVLEEGDLWPNRGFFLKVSDSSHALYVSLSKEQNEMILGNKLKLGQFMYVQRLEKANPIPLLRGLTPIPGRRPCEGTPVDIISPASLVKLLEASGANSIVGKGVIVEKKVLGSPRKLLRGSSDTESNYKMMKRSLRPAKTHSEKIKVVEKKQKLTAKDCEKNGYVDNDSDAESMPSSARHVPKRRSWNQSDMLKVKEIFDNSIAKSEIKLPPRSWSANASPVHSKSDSSDENSSSTSTRASGSGKGSSKNSKESQVHTDENPSSTSTITVGSGKRSTESSNRREVAADKVNSRQLSDSLCSLIQERTGAENGTSSKHSNESQVHTDEDPSSTSTTTVDSGKKSTECSNKSEVAADKVNSRQFSKSLCSLIQERKGAETGTSWNSLPPDLAKLGKEVIRQRNVAMAVAVGALQEACVSERLLNSFSTLSQFNLAEGDDLEPYVDKFFKVQDDLARTRSIMQSLANINEVRPAQETESCADNSAEKILERSKNAIAWIDSAIALDLSPCPSPGPATNPKYTAKNSSPSSCSRNPKCQCIFNKNSTSESDNDNPIASFSDKANQDWPEWNQGSTLPAAFNLAASLQDKCKKLFLSHVDNYLDELGQKIESTESDGRLVAAMYKVKMVSKCLDMVVNKDKESSEDGKNESPIDSEREAYGRVRDKIYGILLKHVERTAMAFERLNASM